MTYIVKFCKCDFRPAIFLLLAFLAACSPAAQAMTVRSVSMTSIQTSAFPELSFSTTVKVQGAPVPDLTSKDFKITEDDIEVTEFSVRMKGLPVDVALVLDTSGSVRDFLRNIKSGATQFVDSLKDSDQALLIEFSDDVLLSQQLTYDKAVLKSAIDDLRARGGTKLYDAIARGVDSIRGGRGIVVVMTDGRDVRKSTDTERYSDIGLEELIEKTKTKGIPVFSIGVGQDIDIKGLTALAEASGGKFLQTMDPAGITEMYRQVSRLINCHYLVTYKSPKPENHGKWRVVKVKEKNGAGEAEGKYQIPLPPELTAKTEPIDTLRLYESNGMNYHITTHDKDFMEVDLKVLSQEDLLNNLDTVLVGKTFCMYDRSRSDSQSRDNFREGKGTGAKTFKLINGQKFFIYDLGNAGGDYNIKVPRGCSVEIYYPRCPITIADGIGHLKVYKGTPSSFSADYGRDPVLFNEGTGQLSVRNIDGNGIIVSDGPGGIDVSAGELQMLDIGNYGVGGITFKGRAHRARIWLGSVGSIWIDELLEKPIYMIDDGVGSISIGKNFNGFDNYGGQGKENLMVKVPAVPPYPGDAVFYIMDSGQIDSPGYDNSGLPEPQIPATRENYDTHAEVRPIDPEGEVMNTDSEPEDTGNTEDTEDTENYTPEQDSGSDDLDSEIPDVEIPEVETPDFD